MLGSVANRWVLGQSSQLPQCSVTQFPCMSNTSQISYMGGGLRAPSPACQDPGEGVFHQTSCCPLPRGQASDPALSAGPLEWLGPHHPELPQHSSLRESRPVLTASLSPP